MSKRVTTITIDRKLDDEQEEELREWIEEQINCDGMSIMNAGSLTLVTFYFGHQHASAASVHSVATGIESEFEWRTRVDADEMVELFPEVEDFHCPTCGKKLFPNTTAEDINEGNVAKACPNQCGGVSVDYEGENIAVTIAPCTY